MLQVQVLQVRDCIPCCKLHAAPVEGSMRSGRHVGCSTPLQASSCTGCVTALLHSTSLQATRCSWLCDCKQPRHKHAAKYLCALPSVLGARCFRAPVSRSRRPWYPRVLGASVPRELHASEFRRLEAFQALCSGAHVATLPQSLGTSVLRHPRCLERYTPRRFDASKPFELHASVPSVALVPRRSTTLVPRHPRYLEGYTPS
ncbi:UNVERIFIED_CONTAM: hypothetical protein FKN15_052143 [Acipenser sinensis]